MLVAGWFSDEKERATAGAHSNWGSHKAPKKLKTTAATGKRDDGTDMPDDIPISILIPQ